MRGVYTQVPIHLRINGRPKLAWWSKQVRRTRAPIQTDEYPKLDIRGPMQVNAHFTTLLPYFSTSTHRTLKTLVLQLPTYRD